MPREFVFMDRAAIGLGGVFLHLGARLNWHDMFNETIEGFVLDEVAERQKVAFAAAGVPLPTTGDCRVPSRVGLNGHPQLTP